MLPVESSAAGVAKNSDRIKSPYAEEDDMLAHEYLRLDTDADLTFREQPECHNVVCQARFGKTIDQLWLIRELAYVSFKRGRFPAATMWHRPPEGATHQIFGSGRMMIMGVHSVVHACCSYQLQRRAFIQHGRADYPMYPIQLENCVYSYHLPYHIRIAELKHEDELGFISVPDLFPGAIYRVIKPAVAMLIFESGSVMILGVRDKSDLKTALEIILPILEAHSYTPDPESSRGASRKRARSEEEKRAEKERRKNKVLVQKAIKRIKYAPVRNKAEFDARLLEEINLMKSGAGGNGGGGGTSKSKQKHKDETETTALASKKPKRATKESAKQQKAHVHANDADDEEILEMGVV